MVLSGRKLGAPEAVLVGPSTEVLWMDDAELGSGALCSVLGGLLVFSALSVLLQMMLNTTVAVVAIAVMIAAHLVHRSWGCRLFLRMSNSCAPSPVSRARISYPGLTLNLFSASTHSAKTLVSSGFSVSAHLLSLLDSMWKAHRMSAGFTSPTFSRWAFISTQPSSSPFSRSRIFKTFSALCRQLMCRLSGFSRARAYARWRIGLATNGND